MASTLVRAEQKGWIKPPGFVVKNLVLEVLMGSAAYGVSNDMSDMDIYAVTVNPKTDLFPHLNGYVYGFGDPPQPFTTWQQHHVQDPDKGREYDFSVYGIVKYSDLVMQNNPNMVDSIFVPRRCVLFSTPAGEHLRSHRKEFLTKKCWHTYRGYSAQQMHKLNTGSNKSNPKRQATIDAFGFDTKFAYHIVRLLLQVEQIMSEHDLDLERNTEILKAIRRGDWTLDRLQKWVEEKERSLENVYSTSTLRHSPDVARCRQIMLEAVEIHYGSLPEAAQQTRGADALVEEIENVLRKYR